MDFTIICPGCGSKLKLFDSQVKQKKGTIRCTRCGQRIKYDLTKPDPVRTGFWAETETPFKVGAQKRFLSIAKARQKNPKQDFPAPVMAPAAAAPEAPRVPPTFDRSHSQFQAFDMKTGTIIGDAAQKPAAPSMPGGPFSMSSLPAAVRLKTPAGSPSVPSVLSKAAPTQKTANVPMPGRKAARTRTPSPGSLRIPHTPSGKIFSAASSQSFFSRLRSFFSSLFTKK